MLYAVISIGVASLGQAILKGAVNGLSFTGHQLNLDFIIRTFTSIKVLLGLALYAISAVLWLYALSRYNLSRIYPLTSLSFIFVILLSRYFLGESMTINQAIGSVLIILGISIVSF